MGQETKELIERQNLDSVLFDHRHHRSDLCGKGGDSFGFRANHDDVIVPGFDAFQDVLGFPRRRRGNGDFAGDPHAALLKRNIDEPFAIDGRFLNVGLKSLVHGHFLNPFLRLPVQGAAQGNAFLGVYSGLRRKGARSDAFGNDGRRGLLWSRLLDNGFGDDCNLVAVALDHLVVHERNRLRVEIRLIDAAAPARDRDFSFARELDKARDVAYRVSQVLWQLLFVLVQEYKVKPEFLSLCENIGKFLSCQNLELIDNEIERREPLLSRERRRPYLRHQERGKGLGFHLPHDAAAKD